MASMDLISSTTLKELADAGSIRHAVVVAQPEGYAITVKYGLTERVVQARRGHVRQFKTIDAAAKALKALGIVRIELDMSNYDASATLFARGHGTSAGREPTLRRQHIRTGS